MTLGQKIKKLRVEKGLTQKDLADKVFVTFQTVSKWEKDENEPDVSTLKALAKLFGCSMDYLLSDEESEEPKEESVPPVVVAPSAPVENKTIIIHQKELHVCTRCGKDIPEDELVMEKFCVRPAGRGHSAEYRDDYYHRDCLAQTKAEREEKERVEFKAATSKAKKRSFLWAIPIGVAVLTISLIVFLTHREYNNNIGLDILYSAIWGYAGFATAYCMASGSYICDVFLGVASWSIKFPGVIFTLDIEGLIFLIAVKILFAVLGFLIGIIVLILAAVLSAVLSMISFPFVLIHNEHTHYFNAK